MSLGNIFKTIAPIAAGAMFGPGGSALAAGSMGTSVAAGALTGAGIAALSGDDPLMGAVSGGLGGASGSGIGTALSGTAAAAPTKTAIPSGMLDASSLPKKAVGSSFTPTAGVNKGVSMTNISMPNTTPDSTFLSRLGGGSKLMGAGKLGAAGLPVIGAAAMPDYSQTEDPMAKYDPNRRLNLNMTTGIKNALARDSGVRLFAQGGYLPYEFSDSTTMDPERFRMFMMQREMREPSRDVVYDEGLQALENERARIMRDPQVVENERARVMRRIDPNVGTEKESRDYFNALMERFEAERQAIKNMPEGPEKDEIMRMNDNFAPQEFYYNQGGYLETGMGDGVSDEIPASLGGEQDVMLSENEFVIPADVVSGLGNGSSDAGAEQLYAMMDRVRKARTGTEKMGKEVNAERLMPA